MKPIVPTLVLMCSSVVFAGVALAEQVDESIRNLPANNQVTLSGTVDQAESNHQFRLRTNTGLIIVSVPPDQARPFHMGDGVVVTGVVTKPLGGVLGEELKASDVKLTHHAL